MKIKFEKIAFLRRLDVLDMVMNAQSGHIGGSMSSMDILVCLYYRIMNIQNIKEGSPDRDRFIMSKGHCAQALYAVLADCGFFPAEELSSFAAFDTKLAEHPTKKAAGIEVATGALGHGLSVGVGMAIGLKQDKSPAKVYVLMGDGEQAEGAIWESVMAAGKFGLDNLIGIIDRNRLQISGSTEEVMPLEDLEAKYRSFGWDVVICDGNDSDELYSKLSSPAKGKPVMVIANTVKGYGSSVMENKASWHHHVPTEEEYQRIKSDFMERIEEG